MDSGPFTILVNTSDGYDDCWGPFFRLLRRHWPECDALAMLNTGRKDWRTPDWPRLACTQVELGAGRRMSWSECLIAALDRVQTPLVLYFQEDYFVHLPVRDELVGEVVWNVVAGIHDLLHAHTEIGLVRDVVAEDVTGGDGGDAERVGDVRRLGALARAGRADDQEASTPLPVGLFVRGQRSNPS